jgi:pimeloyl-ACP methyl ester carboxylesterase
VSRRRTAVLATGIAAGAVAAGAVGRVLVRRRRAHHAPPVGDLPPEDVGPARSFDGTGLAVRAAGNTSSPVLLFVHGFSLDMSVWSHQWPDLAADFRCVLMDLRSHGRSARAAGGDLSIRAMGRDVASVIDADSTGLPVVAIGHSMGAMAILAMAEQRPELFGERVSGVVLIGAASANLLRSAVGSVADLLRPRPGALAKAAGRIDHLRRAVLASPSDVSGVLTRMTQFGPDAPAHLVDHIVALAGRAPSEVWTGGLAELVEVDLRHALPRVKVPALVVVGEHDRVTPPAAAVELAGELPDATLVVLEGAGHVAMLERPERLNREIREFAHVVLTPAARPKRRRKPA